MSSIEISAQIVVCNSFDEISNFIGEKISNGYQIHCVETEYGDSVAFGNGINLNHHGKLQFNQAPCIFENISITPYNNDYNIICLSHIDLDSLGGVAAILGFKPEKDMEDFWFLAEVVDNNGPHRFPKDKYPKEFTAMNIWWTWSKNNRGPRVTSEVQDVTKYIEECVEVLQHIQNYLQGEDNEMLCRLVQDANSLIESEDKLNKESLVSFDFLAVKTAWATKAFPICVRKANEFTNHLYTTSGSQTANCVIALNEKFGSITISFERNMSSILCMDCRKIVQAYPYWGCDSNLAGGKDVIAGSPRDHKYDEKDLEKFVNWFKSQFNNWVI